MITSRSGSRRLAGRRRLSRCGRSNHPRNASASALTPLAPVTNRQPSDSANWLANRQCFVTQSDLAVSPSPHRPRYACTSAGTSAAQWSAGDDPGASQPVRHASSFQPTRETSGSATAPLRQGNGHAERRPGVEVQRVEVAACLSEVRAGVLRDREPVRGRLSTETTPLQLFGAGDVDARREVRTLTRTCGAIRQPMPPHRALAAAGWSRSRRLLDVRRASCRRRPGAVQLVGG
jgi:hypothetical protein